MGKFDANPYALPTVSFVGGSTQKLSFNTFLENNSPFVLEGCNIKFSVVSYTDKSGSPVLSKQMNIESKSVMSIVLESADTMKLSGKYIYQITITHRDGVTREIPSQGIMLIAKNIDQQ